MTKAGRTMDTAIAIDIMGWTPVRGDWWPGAVNPGQWNCLRSLADEFAFEYPGGGISMPDGKSYCTEKVYDFTPSADIEAAFRVVEAMRGVPGNSWWLSLSNISGVHPEWRASFTFGGMAAAGSRPSASALAKTAPLAICIAALVARGVIAPR